MASGPPPFPPKAKAATDGAEAPAAEPGTPVPVGEEGAEVTEPEAAPPSRPTPVPLPASTADARAAASAPSKRSRRKSTPGGRSGRVPRPTVVSPIPALLAASMRGGDLEAAIPEAIAGPDVTSRQAEVERRALLRDGGPRPGAGPADGGGVVVAGNAGNTSIGHSAEYVVEVDPQTAPPDPRRR